MDTSLFPIALATAVVLATIMGFAIQRGATCAVLAVEQLVAERRTQRLRSLLLASAWVLAGLLLAHAFGVTMDLPHGYATTAGTLAGGALLGLGAFVNRSCVFGSIAKLGSGQWPYLATPLGYYLGCVLATTTMHASHQPLPANVASSMQQSLFFAVPVLALLLWLAWRGARPTATATPSLREHVGYLAARRVWEPGAATMVIGITFVGMWLLVGAWTYTDLLGDLAKGMPKDLATRSGLFLALFGGAILGGWSAGGLKALSLSPGKWLRCLCGGALMGFGSSLIPGGNDGLLLVGIPLLWGYAWSAVAAMMLTIAIAILVERRYQARIRRQERPLDSVPG